MIKFLIVLKYIAYLVYMLLIAFFMLHIFNWSKGSTGTHYCHYTEKMLFLLTHRIHLLNRSWHPHASILTCVKGLIVLPHKRWRERKRREMANQVLTCDSGEEKGWLFARGRAPAGGWRGGWWGKNSSPRFASGWRMGAQGIDSVHVCESHTHTIRKLILCWHVD